MYTVKPLQCYLNKSVKMDDYGCKTTEPHFLLDVTQLMKDGWLNDGTRSTQTERGAGGKVRATPQPNSCLLGESQPRV